MAHNRSVGAALLAWVTEHFDIPFEPISNFFLQVRTFPLESKVESFANLSDGFVLSKILGTCSSGALFVLTPLSTDPNLQILQRTLIPPMP